MTEAIRQIDPEKIDVADFPRRFADSIVITKDGKLILQQRPAKWKPGTICLNAFGGGVEPGETPLQAVVRELKEELGAEAQASDMALLGVVTEAISDYKDLVYTYFWRDRDGTITGCYEHEAVYFDAPSEVLNHPQLMEYTRWMLRECVNRKLL